MNRNFFGYILALVISFSTLVSGSAQADPLDNWHWKNPIPQGNALRGVSFGSNKFVAVGDYGTILTSSDLGINWNNRTALNDGSAGTRENLRAIAFGNIGGSGNIAPGFVAVGDNGAILKSTDGGISWALDSTSGAVANFHSVAYGVDATAKQSFVAVGANGSVVRTNDGMAWSKSTTTISEPNILTGEMLNGVAFGAAPNTFVTISNNGNIFYSTDNGDTWTKSPDSNSSRPLRGVSFVNGNFIAVGTAGAIISSANGVNWVVQSSGTAADLNAVTYGAINDTYVVVGSVSKIIGSTTGFTTWRSFPFPEQSTPSNYNILAVTNDGDKTYIAVGENGEILRYNPGNALAVWTAINTGLTNTNVNAITYNTASTNTGTLMELYAATGGGGLFYTKNAGLNWSAINSGLNNFTVNSIAMTPGSGATDDILYTGTAGGLYKSIDAGNAAGTISRIVIPPANVKITAGNASNVLAWNAVTGATSYNIYRSTTAGVTKTSTLLSTVAGTNYTDNSSANGTTYYYAITTNFANSTNTANQESAVSSEVSAKPQISAVYVPDNAAVTAGAAQNTVTWNAVAGDSLSYNVAIDGVKLNVGNTLSYTHVATNGTNHTYSITAVNVVRKAANIAVTKGVISWDPVAGAGSYEILINGVAPVAATSPYTFNGHVTSYAINALNIQTAAASSTTVTESLITWAAVAGALSYNVAINGGAPINVLAPATSYTHNGAVTSNSITVVGGASTGSTSVGTVNVTKTAITWPAVALTDSYSAVINGGAAVSPVISPLTFNGPVSSVTVTALENLRPAITGSLVSTITWDAPTVEPTTYTITINTVVQPVQNAPLTSYDFPGVINPVFSVVSTKAESNPSSVVGATPQATPIQLTSVNTVIVDPVNANTIYLGNNNGLFKSTDAALTFTELRYDAAPISFANVNAIAVDKNTPTTIYVGATAGGVGTGIYKSTSSGITWSLLKSGVVNTIALDPTTTTTIYLGTSLGAFKSSDSGTTWNVTNPGLGSFPVNYFGINPVSPNIIYMGTDFGIFVSYNSGTDWSGFSNGLASSVVNAIAFDPGKTEQIYAGTGGGGMYKLTDVFNINWSSQRNDIVFNPASKSTSEFYGIGFGADNFVAVGNNTITLLGNASLPVVTGDFKAVIYGDNSFMAVGAFGSEGAVYRSDTAGVSWIGPLVDAGTGKSIASSGLYAITYGNGTFVAAGLSGKLLTYTGNVYNNNLVTGVTTHLRAAAFGNGTFVVAGDNGAIITSSDAVSWTARNSGIASQISGLGFGNGRFVAVGTSGVILTSTDNGASWQSVASPTTGNLYGVAFGNGVFAAVGEDAVHGTIFTSSDYGTTWIARPSGTANALYAVAFGKGQFYASGRFGTVIMSDIVPSAPATVTATTPANGATGVPVDAAISAIFSANMNGGTITTSADGTTGSFTIVPAVTVPAATPVTGATISYDSANFRATLAHIGKMEYGTSYTATLTTTILDAAGNALPKEGVNPLVAHTWQFTTESTPDTTGPVITSSSPGSPGTAGVEVPVTTSIQISFDQSDVNTTTLNNNTCKVTDSSNLNVPLNTPVFNGLTATFSPTSALNAGATYHVTITTGVKDMAGNPMLAPYSWDFTTAASNIDVTRPNGTVSPSTDISFSGPIYIQFDEDMKAVTIDSPATSILVKDGNSNIIAGSVLYDPLTRRASFTPTAPLIASATYTVVVTGAATDLAGNAFNKLTAPGTFTITAAMYTVVGGTAVGQGSNGTVAPVLPVTVAAGSNYDIIITPAVGFVLSGLTDNGTAVAAAALPVRQLDGSYKFTLAAIAANHQVLASFAPAAYNVTVNAPVNGSTSPSGVTAVAAGASHAITITPATGFQLVSVIDNGADVTASVVAGVYTINSVTANHTVSVAFSQDATRPLVSSISPNSRVLPGDVLIIKFSEAMQAASINSSTVYIQDPSGNNVVGTLAPTADASAFTFTASVPYLLNTTYKLYATTAAKDTAGNNLDTTGLPLNITSATAQYTVVGGTAVGQGSNGTVAPVLPV
ncbi:MAG: Ig-like domain-containing protein, partial [Desulfuromonadaceae bacterium]